MDELRIKITEDGNIVVESDEVSAGNHSSAEAFLKMMEEQMGNKGSRTKLPQSHTHVHNHAHA